MVDRKSKIIPLCNFVTAAGFQTRSSADADNWLDAFSGQSRSTNMVPFHMLHYSFLLCNSNFVFKTRHFYDIRLQKIS